MTQKNQHGGKRKGAGRNPATDPKIHIPIYIETSIVEAAGGKEAAKQVAVNAIQKEAKKKK
jgi:hypothetical protein